MSPLVNLLCDALASQWIGVFVNAAVRLSVGFTNMCSSHFESSHSMSLILESKNVRGHKERNKALSSLASQRGNMKTTHLSIYTLRDLWLQVRERSVDLLPPDQFMETCVTVEGRAGPGNPGTCSTSVCSCNTVDQGKDFKTNILKEEGYVCLCGCVYCPELNTGHLWNPHSEQRLLRTTVQLTPKF